MVARLFADSSTTWKVGSRRVDQDVNARTALEMIGRQLTMAMVDPVLSMRVKKGVATLYTRTPDDISHSVTFGSMDQRSEIRLLQPYRDIQQIRYAMIEPTNTPKVGYTLVRFSTQSEANPAYLCYDRRNWTTVFDVYPDEVATVMDEHVARFNVYVYVPDANGRPQLRAEYDSSEYPTPPPPLWIDLVLYVLDEDDAIKAANIGKSAGRDRFMDRGVRRYVHRAFPQNSPGANQP